LPNKIFRKLEGKPLIWHIVNRIKPSKKITDIVVATTKNTNDSVLERWCNNNQIRCFRGSENDVLSRFYYAAKKYKSDLIVRITADDPFKDFEIIDNVIDMLIDQNLDFAYNNNPPTFPEGLDTEVFTFFALEKAFNNALDEFEREHVTQYFYRCPFLFKQNCYKYHKDLSYLRWTIDTDIDWQMTELVYSKLYKQKQIFNMNDILELFHKEPHIQAINANEKRSAMYNKYEKIE